MLDELCRLCGNKSDSTLDIFSETGYQEKLELKIKQVVRLNILKEDPLPSIVCNACVEHLQNAIHFIDRCHETQKYLSQLYWGNTTLDNIIITPSDKSNHLEIITMDESDDESNTGHDSIPLSSLQSKNNNSTHTSTKNLIDMRISKENKSYAEAFQNYVAKLSHISSTESQDNSSSFVESTTSICRMKTSKSKTDDVDFEILQNKPQITSASKDRSQLRRKCTLQVTPMNNLNESSDEDNCEQDEHSDDSFVIETIDEEEYDSSSEIMESSCQTLNSLPTSNENNSSKKKVSKNSTLLQSASSLESKQSAKNNDLSRTEKKDKKGFRCSMCRKTFSHELTYQEHLNVHTGKRPFSCKLCTASFRSRQDLNQHLRTVHSKQQLKCPSCDHIAKYKGKLTEHIKSVHEKPFACDMCNYRTGEKGKIMSHIINKHTVDTSFVCEICGNGFKTKNSMRVHLKNIHFPEPKVCQNCGTICTSLTRYSAHVFKCGKERKRYVCDKCGRSYVNKEILKGHINKHMNVKPYKCKICDKEFYQRSRLDTHKFVHRGATYQCEICNKFFNRKDNMKNHMKRHFYKPMKCDNTIVTAV